MLKIRAGHQAIGQPERQAINNHQRLRLAVLRQRVRQMQRLFDNRHGRNPLCAILLMTRDTLAHFVIASDSRGDQNGAMPGRLRQPINSQHFGPPRLAALLPAQYQLTASGLHRFTHAALPNRR